MHKRLRQSWQNMRACWGSNFDTATNSIQILQIMPMAALIINHCGI